MHLPSDKPQAWLGSAADMTYGSGTAQWRPLADSVPLWFPLTLGSTLPLFHLSLLSSFLPTLQGDILWQKGPIQSNCLETEHRWLMKPEGNLGKLTSGPRNFTKSFFLHFSCIQGRLKSLLFYHLKRSYVIFSSFLLSPICTIYSGYQTKVLKEKICDYFWLFLSFFASFLKGRESKCFNFFSHTRTFYSIQ